MTPNTPPSSASDAAGTIVTASWTCGSNRSPAASMRVTPGPLDVLRDFPPQAQPRLLELVRGLAVLDDVLLRQAILFRDLLLELLHVGRLQRRAAGRLAVVGRLAALGPPAAVHDFHRDVVLVCHSSPSVRHARPEGRAYTTETGNR